MKCLLPAVFLVCSAILRGTAGSTDSLLRSYRQARTATEKAAIAYQLALVTTGDFPRHHSYALEGFAAIRREPPAPVTVQLAEALGTDYTVTRRFDSAQYYFDFAANVARRIRRPDLEHGVYAGLGRLYAEQGDYPKALQIQYRNLAYWEKTTDTLRMVRTGKWIADIYAMMGRPQDATLHLQKAFSRLQAMRGKTGEGKADRLERRKAGSYVLYSQGVNFRALGRLAESEAALRQTIATMQQTGDRDKIANAWGELGVTLEARGDRNGAAAALTQGVNAAEAQGIVPVANVLRQALANMQMQRGEFQAAYELGHQLLATARASGDIRIERGALETLAAIADSTGCWKEAYGHLQRLRVLDDTLASANYQSSIADAETRYKTEAALRTRDSLAFQNRLVGVQQRAAVRQRNLAVGIGATVVLAVTLLAIGIFRIRSLRAKQQEEQRATRALFEGEQAERIRIARDLHDSIGQMLSLARMQVSGLGAGAQPSVDLLDKTIGEVRTISHNLIPEELNYGLLTALDALCDRIRRNGNLRATLRADEVIRSLRFTKPFETAVYRIVQEATGNMLKHADATEIAISLERSETGISLAITDNGKGFDTSRIEGSGGLGWKNIRARVNLLNGAMEVKSERITGTRIEIALPQ